MISKLSTRITENLLRRNIILCDEKELYNYGLFMIISYATFFLISILFGVVFNIPLSSIIFYISFCAVRNFAGGIHANTEIKCDIITTVSIFISELLIKVFIDCHLTSVTLIMLVISSLCLCILKPVSSSQKEITQHEKIYFHKKVIILTIAFLLISILCIANKKYFVAVSLSMGLSLANVLLILGYLQLIFIRKR